MKFTLEIELGGAAMQTWMDARAAIAKAIDPIRLSQHAANLNYPHSGDAYTIRDANGNAVGTWVVTE